MKLYLVRHGETALNEKGCYYGKTDAVLSVRGIEQAKYLQHIFKEVSFDMIYPFGIDKESSILDAAISTGIVEKSGAWFKFADKQLAQGRDSTIALLKEDKKLRDEIEKAVRATMK